MNTCFKMIFLLTLSFGIFVSEKAEAEFKGCNDFCGRRANNLWAAEVRAGRASGNATAAWLRERFNTCMQQTLDEGKTSVEECNGDPSVANVPVPSSNPNRCESEYSEKVAACEAQLSSAKNSCDSNKSSAFASSSSGTSSSEGIADACKKSASLSGTAKDAWTSFGSSCSTAMNSCMDACAEISTWAQNNPTCFPLPSSGLTAAQINQNVYSPKISQCMDLQSTVDTANKNASTYSDSAATSAECEKSASGGTNSNTLGGLAQSALGLASGMLASSSKAETSAAVASFCTTNPAYPGCSSSASLNCSDPTQAASNKVCICAASPRDPQCMTAQTESSFSNSAMIDSSSRLPGSTADNMSGDIPSTNVDPLASKLGGSGSVDGIDGRQGGAPVGNSTVGSGSGPNRAGANAGSVDSAAGAGGGFMGGGGSGGRGFGSAGSAGAGSAGYRAQNAGGGSAGTTGGPDLRQFLPGGMQDPRARGMIGGVGTDGITGPHTNIWNKVQNRYQILKDTLYP